MKPRKIEIDTWDERATKALCEAWREMNEIRARDGTPVGSSVTQEYWNEPAMMHTVTPFYTRLNHGT